ncbi:MMPL family transporter [Kribbella sp. NPDC051587]|uniref:MMPL family transporter n=1 Tax=Kribbella sp. NPDC051587 TaxID=3364119 RepID=UPI0037B11CA7
MIVLAAVAVAVGVFLAPPPTTAVPRSATGLSTEVESVKVEKLQQQLADNDRSVALLVASRTDGGALTDADQRTLATKLDALKSAAPIPPARLSDDKTVALATVVLAAENDDAVIAAVDNLRSALKPQGDDALTIAVTGPAGFTTDLTRVFDGADTRLLIVTAAVVALLLLLTYRSPALVAIPLVIVAATEQTTLKLAEFALAATGIPAGGQVTGIASVLVFGAATDYALLLIARYREQLRLTEDSRLAVQTAVRRIAEPVLASGGTVIGALLILLLASTETLQGIAIACIIGVVLAVISALVILPAGLRLFGRGVFWPFVPRQGEAGREGRVWGRLGRAVEKRPVAVLAGSILALGIMSAGIMGLNTGLAQNEQFRAEPEAVRGAKTLAAAFPAGTTEPVTVITAAKAAGAVTQAVKEVPGVASVRPGAGKAELAQLDVVLNAEAGTKESFAIVEQLRDRVHRISGANALVGGEPAQKLDVSDADGRDRLLIIPLILVLVAAVLVLLLRSLLAPFLLVATVVASFFAAFGASWFLSSQVFGFPALDGSVVLLSFLFLVALGVDYNIFLTTRAREEAKEHGTRRGMLNALTLTGGVITSAGILLAAVFAVLGVLPLITLTQVGIIVCTGVLLDTLLVRTVVVPALAFVLGDRFWWPARP